MLITILTLLVCVSSVLWTTQPFILILLPLLLAAFRLRVLGTTALGLHGSDDGIAAWSDSSCRIRAS